MSRRTKGILSIIAAAFCFAALEALARLAGDIPSMQKCAVRNIVAFLAVLPVGLRRAPTFRVERRALPLLIVRCSAGTMALMLNFYAFDRMLLANAAMLQKTAPFFAVIFSIFLLGEKPQRLHWACVGAALAGCVFIVKPELSGVRLPELAALCCGILSGFAYTCIRLLSEKYALNNHVIVVYGCLLSAVVTLPALIFHPQPMDAGQLALLIAAGLFAAGGQYAVTAAYVFAPAREISVYDYSQIVFSAAFGLLLFDQIPDGYSAIGYVVILSASIVMFVYNNRKAHIDEKERG